MIINLMPAARSNPALPALCAALLLWPAGAAVAGLPSVAALQAEFIRRINQAEQVSSLFEPGVLIPDFSGLRGITVLQDRNAQASPAPGADIAQAKLRVQLRLQAAFSSDCPAVDEHLAQIGENSRTWDEVGWMEITYQHSGAGWQIGGLNYRADEKQPLSMQAEAAK
jgi:hypothetical protein